jgi:hypothetical protein
MSRELELELVRGLRKLLQFEGMSPCAPDDPNCNALVRGANRPRRHWAQVTH